MWTGLIYNFTVQTNYDGGGIMKRKKAEYHINTEKDKLNHVGGIAGDAGGVDPDIDQNLIRLSGGP